MDPIDILGSLLGHKTSQGGRGGDVLSDIFGGRPQPQAPTRERPTSIDEQAKALEELLNIAKERNAHSPHTKSQSAQTRSTSTPSSRSNEEDRAVLLVRAMVSAAKADGKLDSDEQQAIINQLKNPTREDIDFLRGEFDRPVNVDEFARSIPVGMEQQVYAMSLIAIDLDTGDEAKYLMKLADGLRLSKEDREAIHTRMGAPSIY